MESFEEFCRRQRSRCEAICIRAVNRTKRRKKALRTDPTEVIATRYAVYARGGPTNADTLITHHMGPKQAQLDEGEEEE
jgi:hypothetical protein